MLRPFVRAANQLALDNARAAADALQIASRGVAARVPAARELAQVVSHIPELPSDARMVAALAAGETAEAIKIGEADPNNLEARAEIARAEIALPDLGKATKILATLKSAPGSPALSLARAELYLKKGKRVEADSELAPLLERTPPDSATLAYVASLPPGALAPRSEALAVTAAHRVAKSLPGVASMIGLRAARGGNRTEDTLGMVNVDDLGAGELPEVGGMIQNDPSLLGKSLAAMVARRRADATVVDVPGAPTASPPVGVQAENADASIAAFAGRIAYRTS